MQNLREVVYDTQVLAMTCLPRKRDFFIRRGSNYLIRYFFLILINAYLQEELCHNYKRVSFTNWLEQRSELLNLLRNISFPEIKPDKQIFVKI